MPSVAISSVVVADLPTLAAIEARGHSNPWSLETLRLELANPCSILLKAAGGDRTICGYTCGWIVGDELQVHNLVVDPAHQRAGIGRALLDALMAAAAERGAAIATLEVRAGNAAALALYRGRGFVVAGSRPGYYDLPREDALIMTAPVQRSRPQ